MSTFMERFSEKIQEIRDLNKPKPQDALRDSFINEITRFYEDGTEPEHASADMRYYLQTHEKRLAEKGVRIQRRYTVTPDGVKATRASNRPPYTASLSFRECESSTQFTNVSTQKILKKHKKCASIFYANILDRADSQDAEFECPNCGHRATLAVFANGCPMCGTRFQMKQLFPCVTNFYLLSQLANGKSVEKIIPIVRNVAILFALGVGTYTTVTTWGQADPHYAALLFGLGAALLAGFLGFIVFYLVFSIFFAIFMMGKMTTQAVTTADVQSAALTKNSLTKAMQRFDPEFSYDLFEGKVISLFRAIAYSEDRTNMSIYRGDPNLPELDTLIDIDYRGAMKYLNSRIQDGDNLVLLVRVYFNTTHLIKGKIVQKKEDYNMTLVKKLTAKENYGFSIHAVNCKACAASFDAMHVLQCPTCGAPYKLEEEDWVVYGLKK
ncbi:MAG: hypothetical protein J6Y58_03730 [Clostridiales bacterium]|nr:hypothetical protein [Clostridiales bacterium]